MAKARGSRRVMLVAKTIAAARVSEDYAIRRALMSCGLTIA